MTRARRTIWLTGAPARAVAVGLIRIYRLTLSSSLGGQCRFYPSCSHYAEEAIRVHGLARGSVLALWRIARCGPFTDGGIDRVPSRDIRHELYDAVTPLGRPS